MLPLLLSVMPQFIDQIAGWVVAIGIIFGASWLAPVRKVYFWIWRTLVSDPFSKFMEKTIVSATQPHNDYVRYHLGPNGSTKPVHQRLVDLEHQVTQAAARNRLVLDNVDVLICESDAQGNCNYVNLYLCETLRCNPEDWYGDGWKLFIAPEEVSGEEVRLLNQIHTAGSSPFHPVTLLVKGTGERIPSRSRSMPIEKDGLLVGLIGEFYLDRDDQAAATNPFSQ